jgi:hypothetical protein
MVLDVLWGFPFREEVVLIEYLLVRVNAPGLLLEEILMVMSPH